MENRTTQTYGTAGNDNRHSTSTPLPKAKNLTINSERQYRLLLAVIERAQATNHLIQIVGANNVPDLVMKMRRKGWVIHTINTPVYDRDGHKVSAGSYKLDDSQTDQAKEALRAFLSKKNGGEV